MVDGAALEMLCRATYRGFESHLLREWRKSFNRLQVGAFLVVGGDLNQMLVEINRYSSPAFYFNEGTIGTM